MAAAEEGSLRDKAGGRQVDTRRLGQGNPAMSMFVGANCRSLSDLQDHIASDQDRPDKRADGLPLEGPL
jgi:hypothetical protein